MKHIPHTLQNRANTTEESGFVLIELLLLLTVVAVVITVPAILITPAFLFVGVKTGASLVAVVSHAL